MRDRIPTKVLDNGAVRYAVYDENGTFLRYEYMLPADEPADEGTLLSKETLLSDDAEIAIFGDAADRTMSEAIVGAYTAALQLMLVGKYTVAGSYEWICPEDGEYIALILGAGGSGGAVAYTGADNASGGAAGYAGVKRGTYAKGQSIPLVVGAGGAARIAESRAVRTGYAGGSSSFDGVSSAGGSAGKGLSEGIASGASGGQCSTLSSKTGRPPYGGVPIWISNDTVQYGTPVFGTFLDENGLPVTMLCAGGAPNQSFDTALVNGNIGSNGVYSTTAAVVGTKATDPGAGGGAAKSLSSYTATSAAGADGGVFIYKIIRGAMHENGET